MQQIKFGTKADNLISLRKHSALSQVKPLISFTLEEWETDQSKCLAEAMKLFAGKSVVVRSSCRAEDTATESKAGAFESLLNIIPESNALIAAVEHVSGSYPHYDSQNQVFIQEQVLDIKMAGVLFTRDLDTLAPYYIINYDETSGRSDTVTAGEKAELKTYVRYRYSANAPLQYEFKQLLAACDEIEKLFGTDALDIEFAITNAQEVFVLQVRPIVVGEKQQLVEDRKLSANLARIHQRISTLNAPHPGICGNRAIYSVMTDWNPAEIVGVKPHALALSLYKELVTDSIWAYQRDNYGYRNLRSFPLLHSFVGLPYIDVRASFNSFIPKSLDDKLAQKLVDYYTEMLVGTPTDHDKVEFNIIFSCYYLNLPRKIKRLFNYGFTELELDRIKYALLNLTNQIISQKDGLYKADIERVKQLDARFEDLMNNYELPLSDKVYWLLEDCKRYGTLPFAGLARAGFIAVQFLRSFIELEIISEEDFDDYMNSLNTVAKQLARDTAKLRSNELSRDEFLALYGHLRPGTYDMLSPSYDEAFDRYFAKGRENTCVAAKPDFEFSARQMELISAHLTENGILVSAKELLNFLREAIEGREQSKFVFTRHLSQILKFLRQLGASHSISEEEMSFVHINTLRELYSSVLDCEPSDLLREDIARNRKRYGITESIRLPQLITSPDDVYDFYLAAVEPNFITRGAVTSIVVLEKDLPYVDLSNKIALIRSADPGYDWIFSQKLAGLITLYGGANSHMAIRCAELKIPAVIGCGEQNFREWEASKMLEIDCAKKVVRTL